MANKQPDNGLFPTTSLMPAGNQSAGALFPVERKGALARAERRIMGEAHKRQLVITEEQRISEHGQRAIAALHVHDNQLFTETADTIWAMRTPNGRDPELQRYIDHYAAQNIQSAGTHLHITTAAGSRQIVDIVDRALYVATEERAGFWVRVFGGDE